MTGKEIATALHQHKFSFDCEDTFQLGVARVLTQAKVPFEREFSFGTAGRIDFLCNGGVGLELKIKGDRMAVIHQLFDYARCPEVK